MTPPLDKARGLMAIAKSVGGEEWFSSPPYEDANGITEICSIGPYPVATPKQPNKRQHYEDTICEVWHEEQVAKFIVAACNFARTDLPELVAEVERLRNAARIAANEMADAADADFMGDSYHEAINGLREAMNPTAPAKEPQP